MASEEEFHQVSNLLPEPWPPDVVGNLENWQQGNLVPGHNLVWLGCDNDVVTGTSAPETLDAVSLPARETGWMVVTSQTCDVLGTGAGAHSPFVQVSPVIDATDWDPARQQEVREFKVGYLFPVTAPPVADAFMVVDLRISVPVSKAVLANHAAGVSAFASEVDRTNFAEALAIRLRRPAVHDALSEKLVAAFSGHFKGQQKQMKAAARKAQKAPAAAVVVTEAAPPNMAHQLAEFAGGLFRKFVDSSPRQPDPSPHPEGEGWWRGVEQVRVIINGDRLKPTSIQFVIVTGTNFSDGEKQPWWAFLGPAKAVLKEADIRVNETVVFSTLADLSAALYKASIPLRLKELPNPPTF